MPQQWVDYRKGGAAFFPDLKKSGGGYPAAIMMKQCNMEDISAVSSLASKLGMKSLLTFLYNNPDEYLAYIKDNK